MGKGAGAGAGHPAGQAVLALRVVSEFKERIVQAEALGRRAEPIAVDGEAEPVVVKLGVWISNTTSRRDKLDQEQLDALRELGVEWA
ncbi:hypothetical protein ACFTUC_02725 [Streptomyces sp. NPDC056944]|uniref:hypothetical protein n=1 Tax=Streptomyces sp. NPDC056944 TaxID=3345972 RepID=UPI003638A0C2